MKAFLVAKYLCSSVDIFLAFNDLRYLRISIFCVVRVLTSVYPLYLGKTLFLILHSTFALFACFAANIKIHSTRVSQFDFQAALPVQKDISFCRNSSHDM